MDFLMSLDIFRVSGIGYRVSGRSFSRCPIGDTRFPGHYHISNKYSPPTFPFRASVSVIIPFEVESTAKP